MREVCATGPWCGHGQISASRRLAGIRRADARRMPRAFLASRCPGSATGDCACGQPCAWRGVRIHRGSPRVLACRLTCAFAPCLERAFSLRRFPTSWRGAGWRFFEPGGRPGPGLPGGVAGDDQPGPPVRGGRVADLGGGPAQDVLEAAAAQGRLLAPVNVSGHRAVPDHHSHTGLGSRSPGRWSTCSRIKVPSMTGSGPS
jgi:hypothetical protein